MGGEGVFFRDESSRGNIDWVMYGEGKKIEW